MACTSSWTTPTAASGRRSVRRKRSTTDCAARSRPPSRSLKSDSSRKTAMPSLIDIRRRIRSVKNTQQITKAMKMVSAAKLRRAQDRVIASRPYGSLLRKVLANVAAAAGSGDQAIENPLLAQRPERRILLVFITGDKGLAGAFNSNLIKGAQRFIAERPDASVKLELDGRKGRDFFRKRHREISGDHIGLAAKVDYAEVAVIAQKAMEMYR